MTAYVCSGSSRSARILSASVLLDMRRRSAIDAMALLTAVDVEKNSEREGFGMGMDG